MNAKVLSAAVAVAVTAAASAVAQTTMMATDQMAQMDHNQMQTPSTVPNNGPGSPRAGATATAPVVNNAGSSDTPPDDAARVESRAGRNENEAPSTVPNNGPGSPRAGATATAPVVDNGGPPQ